MNRFLLFCFVLMFVVPLINGYGKVAADGIVTLQILETSGIAQQNINLTFGHVFIKGEVPGDAVLEAEISGGSSVPLQVDKKAYHSDGSLRHAIFTTVLPELESNSTKDLILRTASSQIPGDPVRATQVLATDYDAVVSLNIGGTLFTASARDLLQNDTSSTWLSGPLVTEWLVNSSVKDGNGNPHPHLTARFNIRAYTGLSSIRTDVILENNWSFVSSPQNFSYDVSITISGKNVVFTQNDVTHYRQARWRRVFWWGTMPQIHIKHDARYLMKTGAVPTYDTTLVVPEYSLNEMVTEFNAGSDLMKIGYLDPYMPSGGGREEIAPLPRWTARYLISQDARAKYVMLGFSEQAGSWSIHYRDKDTNLPVSIDDYPNMSIVGETSIFPRCGGNCSTPYEPDVAHQPSLSYLPYLVTGDHFHLEELQFWANWNMFYGDPYNHHYSEGLISWEEVRGQAWGIRTLGHAAYITPDDHPLKSYFLEKLDNNIQYYNENWLDWNPLGYITNQAWLDLDNRIATWMDDFLTWTFGHLSELGFSKANAFAAYKAKFPVGRMTHPDMCWILASTYWCAIMTPYPFTAESRPCTTWAEYKETIIKDWKSAFKIDSNPDISGQEQDLINAACNSTQMASILRLPIGAMIGYAYDPEGYPSNLQPALAVAVELGVENALQAWNIFDNRTVKPDEYDGGYNANPQWAIIPGIKIPVVSIINTENNYSQKNNVIQIFPNPFNASAKVTIELIKTSHVQVTVYNILGQKIETLIDKTFPSGNNYIYWKPENLSGGLYLLNILIGDINYSIKVLYLK